MSVLLTPPVFARQLMLCAALAAGIAMAMALTMTTRDNSRLPSLEDTPAGIDSYSALGYRALHRYLMLAGLPTRTALGTARAQASGGDVVVLAEPRRDATTLAMARAALSSGNSLLVLPKYVGTPDHGQPGWVANAELVAPATVTRVLQLAAPGAVLVRPAKPARWTRNDLALRPDSRALQLFRSSTVRPLVASSDGILVGEIVTPSKRIIILADPEIVTNRGIGRADNARIALALVERLRGSGGAVWFEQATHAVVPAPRHPLWILFSFPLSLFMLQLALGFVLLAWSGWGRMGRPRAAAAALPCGRGSLLRTSAALLARRADPGALADRYVRELVGAVARQLHAPAGLGEAEQLGWLAAIAAAHGIRGMPQPGQTAGHGDLYSCLQQARDAFDWKREMLHEHQRDQKHRRPDRHRNAQDHRRPG
jgi:hypothetical protein